MHVVNISEGIRGHGEISLFLKLIIEGLFSLAGNDLASYHNIRVTVNRRDILGIDKVLFRDIPPARDQILVVDQEDLIMVAGDNISDIVESRQKVE